MTRSMSPSSKPAPRLWALVPCAGAGLRAATRQPKQYEVVAGQPLVLHTLAALAAVERLAGTLVVVAPGDDFFARNAVPGPRSPLVADCGGESRARTVSRGLAFLRAQGAKADDWVLVHDAARCLVTAAWIDRLIDACVDDPVGGLLAQPVADTLKFARHERVGATVDRSQHWLAQTPQMFRLGLLQEALLEAGASVTDESSAIEALGHQPRLVPGNPLNLKVTYPEDFLLAEAVLRQRMGGTAP